MQTKLLIVDDHEMIRDGINYMILAKRDHRDLIVLEAESIAEAKEIILQHRPDLILVDYRLKDGTGNTLISWQSEVRLKIPCIALSNYADNSCVKEMTDAGAKGYILKDIERDELMYAINEVLNGGEYFSPNLRNAETPELPPHLLNQVGVTKRELEVLKLMMNQMTTDEISKQLYLSKRTVETHRYHLLKKFKVKNSLSLIKTVLTQCALMYSSLYFELP